MQTGAFFPFPIHSASRKQGRRREGSRRAEWINRRQRAVKRALVIETKEKKGGRRGIFSPLRPGAISGCVTAGGCRAQVAQMPQTHTHTLVSHHRLLPPHKMTDTSTYRIPIQKKILRGETYKLAGCRAYRTIPMVFHRFYKKETLFCLSG